MVRKRHDPADFSVEEFHRTPVIGTAFVNGTTLRGKAVQYVEIDGMAIFEGDIELGPVKEINRVADLVRRAPSDPAAATVLQGVIITGQNVSWPNCEVPYEIDSALANQARVTDAIAHWEENTSFRFILRTSKNRAQFPDFVTFTTGGGCSAAVGRVGGQQFVRLAGGCSTGNTIHEIGHAVGLWHEQSREDRDAFVTIQWENIIPGLESNFSQHITDGDDVGNYDYGSIMHYPRDAFTVNGQDTIVPTQAGAQIGQRVGLSGGDIAAANFICQAPYFG